MKDFEPFVWEVLVLVNAPYSIFNFDCMLARATRPINWIEEETFASSVNSNCKLPQEVSHIL